MRFLLEFDEWRLTESISYLRPDYSYDDYIASLKAAQRAAEGMGTSALLWRGGSWKAGHRSSSFLRIENTTSGRRTTFRGATAEVTGVISGLRDRFRLSNRQPVFATTQESTAQIFGMPHIMVPEPKHTALQSPLVRDLAVDTKGADEPKIEEIIDSYRVGYTAGPEEVIVDTGAYYLVNLPGFLQALPRKWQMQFSKIGSYAQLADLFGKRAWLAEKQK